ncbi:unnamed protein product [Rhizophagus irregularis]|uniref:Uncharacterized protein n=1 Tax=Rhizophagus irregularis TaxID=588596 RepID=A0A2N1MNC5_9GLOM|nr:hypothetical protein RhiirC2_855242 [Rhizophagus irregularis]CAB4399547.1 unnamed protein product [Rhizophagus irregularis]CAB5367550.1 unnamed protein product [Rhizophagus irregularis]
MAECYKCEGFREIDCRTCGGDGYVSQTAMGWSDLWKKKVPSEFRVRCNGACKGRGTVTCTRCRGTGRINKD